MKATRNDLIRLFETMGWTVASKWQPKKMAKKLKDLVEMATDGEVDLLGDERLADLLRAIVEADGEVDIVTKESDLDVTEPPCQEDDATEIVEDVPDELAVEEVLEDVVEPPKKERKAKKEPKKNAERKSIRPKVFGRYSAGPFVRWLGIQGVDLDGAKFILESEGVGHLKDNSVKMELRERREKQKPAVVSAADVEALRKKYPHVFKGNA